MNRIDSANSIPKFQLYPLLMYINGNFKGEFIYQWHILQG